MVRPPSGRKIGPYDPPPFLTGFIVCQGIGFIATGNLLQGTDGSIVHSRHIKVISFCTAIMMQRNQYHAIALETDIQALPGTGAESSVRRAYVREFVVTRFINEQETDRRACAILRSIDTDWFPLYRQWDKIMLEVCEQLHHPEHSRLRK